MKIDTQKLKDASEMLDGADRVQFEAKKLIAEVLTQLENFTPGNQVREEPYAAITVDLTGCEWLSRDIEGIEKVAAQGSNGPTDVVYLYAGEPPAPAPKVEPKPQPEGTGSEREFPAHPDYKW